MKYNRKGLDFIIEELKKNTIIEKSRKNKKDFIRKRKIGPKELIEYNLNKKGLSSKMEKYKFLRITGYKDISSPGLLKQREKLNPEVFVYLNQGTLKLFYNECKDEVKLYKGYVVAAIDGSDFEIPNTKASKKEYSALMKNEECSRSTVSTMTDVLNGYVLDTLIRPYRTSEIEMEKEHFNNVKKIIKTQKIIRVKDRNYRCLEDFYYSNKNNEKYVVRLKEGDYKEYTGKMKSNDEEIEIEYQYDRVRYYRKRNPELYKELEKKEPVKIRIVKVKLENGTTEILATNLEQNKFSIEDLKEIYSLRWGIETLYHTVKESLKIGSISSSKKTIIEQEILSQMLVYNIVQSFCNEAESKIQQEKYKYPMKINKNMAIGMLKEDMIYILMEENEKKRVEMTEELEKKILEYLVPIRKRRNFKRGKQVKNRHHINKRKSF